MNFGNIFSSDSSINSTSTFEFHKKSCKDLSKEAWDAAGWAVYGKQTAFRPPKSSVIRREDSEKLKKAIEERMCNSLLCSVELPYRSQKWGKHI